MAATAEEEERATKPFPKRGENWMGSGITS